MRLYLHMYIHIYTHTGYFNSNDTAEQRVNLNGKKISRKCRVQFLRMIFRYQENHLSLERNL